jgi:hypothetical protein
LSPAARSSPHTQVIELDGTAILWVGAVGEDLLTQRDAPRRPDARKLLGSLLLDGSRNWELIAPGRLLSDWIHRHLSTVYEGDRPWLVVGALANRDLVAVPLNDASNPKWYAPVIQRADVLMPGSTKDSQVELAHMWSFPSSVPAIGRLAPAAVNAIQQVLIGYYRDTSTKAT